jgi:hypothetical protein
MPRFSIVVKVDHADDLESAWLALMSGGLGPTLPTVLKGPNTDHGPILVSFDAETAPAAEGRVRDALHVLEVGTFSVAEDGF